MSQGYPKVGVGVIVLKDVGGKPHVMMHQRKAKLGIGSWGTGGGHLELGESLMEGALRELREEAGPQLKVRNVKFLGVMNLTQFPPKHYVDVSFVARWAAGEPENESPEETTEWQWFALDTLPEPLFPPVATYLKALDTGEVFFDSAFE